MTYRYFFKHSGKIQKRTATTKTETSDGHFDHGQICFKVNNKLTKTHNNTCYVVSYKTRTSDNLIVQRHVTCADKDELSDFIFSLEPEEVFD